MNYGESNAVIVKDWEERLRLGQEWSLRKPVNPQPRSR